MEIVKIVCIGVVCAVACMLLKETRPEIAILIAIAGGVLILLSAIGYLSGIIGSVKEMLSVTGLDSDLFTVVLKMIGIGYIAEFGAGVCEESGNKSLGDKIILAGKIFILAMGLPIIAGILKLLVQLL